MYKYFVCLPDELCKMLNKITEMVKKYHTRTKRNSNRILMMNV